jgi:hypothetical protein
MLDTFSDKDDFFNLIILRYPQRHPPPKTKDRKTIDAAVTGAYDESVSDGAIQPGGCTDNARKKGVNLVS